MELDVSMKSVGVSPGDVNSLLSIISDMRHLPRKIGGLVDVDRKTLWVKNVVFVCLYMPADFDLEPEPFYPVDLIHTCSELYLYRDDFEVVLVSKMNDNFHNSEFLFKESLFPFPHSSLVVPFNNPDGRNYVCDLLKLRDPGIKCLYVNARKGILHHGEPDSMVHHLKGLLEKSSFDAQRSRERLLNSMWPVKSQELKLTSSLAPCPIARILEREKPKYSDDITKMVSDSESYPIEIHKSLDVKFLLSRGMCESDTLVRNNGEKVQVEKAFRDKYIMVCSFYVPIFREYMEAKYVQSLSTVCSELYAKRTDFEMVVVAKMNTLADDKMVFDRFLSGFCSSCFVIPYDFTYGRDFICRHLDLNSPLVQCLILDKGMDMKRNVLYHKFPGVVRDYGADAFPFDDQKLNKLRKDERLQWESPLANNLVELLGCRPSDTLVKINAGCGPDVVTISDLSKKVVGLFLCVQGNFIPMLKNVYEQCLAQQKAFEVVLVYMPFSDCLNPQDFQCYVDNLLQKHKLSVWRFPFDNSVSLKLERLSRSSYNDEVVIIGANSKIERYGREVMTSCGIDAYPFTREGLVQRELERLGQLTFESLLMYGPQDDHFLYHKKVKFPVSSLKSRNILLWIGSLPFDKDFYDRLSAWYTDIKPKNNFEVVFVRSHASLVQIEDLVLSEIMPWYVCPFNCDHSASVLQELFMEGGVTPTTAVVEFDTNGHVRSLEAHYLLDDNGSGSFPIGSSALRRDVIKNFRRSYDFMFDFV